ncbi:rRNA maturation RNase YbeY [Phycisphaeraceae bacterium D3-23]
MTLADTSEPAPPSPDEPPSTPGAPPPAPLTIDLSLQTDDAEPPLAGWLEGMLSRAAEHAGVTCGRLSLVVVDDEEMAQLHEQWKNVPGTTDVLTFDLAEPDAPDDWVEGDIVLCIDEARRVALDRGHALRHEALLYAIHGMLHLLGEDDQDPAGYEQMHHREDDILTRLGVGKVFDTDANDA